MGLWNWLTGLFCRRAPKRDAERPLISLVLLLSEPRPLDEHVLTHVANKAWGIELSADDVTGVSLAFVIQCHGRLYLVNNFPTPYAKDVQAEAENIKELRLRKAFQEHRAWLSVDLLGEERPENLPEVYRQIGKLVAELADTDCLALYSPATQQMVPYDASLEEELRGPDAMEAFRRFVQVPVFDIADDDPRMQAAVAEARRRWPEFVAAFERRTPRHRFAVKAPFTEGEHTEFMWIMVTALEGDRILGTLENEPVELRRLRYGSKVSVRCADLNDWVVSDGQNIEAGGFTIDVLKERIRDEEGG